MTNDQPTTTTRTPDPEMQAWLERAAIVQQRYSVDHKAGMHENGNALDGCASCVFSGRFEPGGGK